ncbi:GNAT family N-acetyltransferase [Paenibacillus eucommiae]|uniref:Ribosomal protein S18 acetylase RimI-like enzyme n=1 Tax=Paenibacillus eucommiae TaxID=1355755 RepID=A0ABS4J868_9BACL|nr:GNAT family N-acetyltransferase [Paenibacillus eucommiae]MBP1996032.1 ribosomal protein S18 acetylase RimI-like enzyme [Paenibacillus eucommiae]
MKDGVRACRGLDENELRQIKRLSKMCNEADGIKIKLNGDMLRERSRSEINDFLYYDQGELIGFIGIYSFISTEVEISGMVHPDYRRGGVFSRLVAAATEECRRRGVPRLVFICQHGSASGAAFLTALGAEFLYSEFRMEMQKYNGPQIELIAASGMEIQLRKAQWEDSELLVKLNMSGFNMQEQDARAYVEKSLGGRHEQTLIAELGQIPIGKISYELDEGEAFIYGFCVLSAYRGKGLGRAMLSQTIQILQQHDPDALSGGRATGRLDDRANGGVNGKLDDRANDKGNARVNARYNTRSNAKLDARLSTRISLEVETANEGALGLYLACGFQVINRNDYYVLMREIKGRQEIL